MYPYHDSLNMLYVYVPMIWGTIFHIHCIFPWRYHQDQIVVHLSLCLFCLYHDIESIDGC